MGTVTYSLVQRLTNLLRYVCYAIQSLKYVLVYVIILVLGIPVYLFREVLILLTKYFHPDLGDILNPLSSMLVGDFFSPKHTRSNIVAPITLDGNISLGDLQQVVLDKCVNATVENGEWKYPQWRQFPVPWFGFTFWKSDTQFDIKNHVHCHPSRNGVTDKELNEFVEGLLNAPGRNGRSPWEFHILQNYWNPKLQEGEMSVIILKVHHSLADGYSVLSALVTDIFGAGQLNHPKVNYPTMIFWERLKYSMTIPFNLIYELSVALLEGFKGGPWTSLDKEKSWHQSYAKTELLPIEQVKNIKNTFGVTFTSVLLSAISAGICKNLEEKKAKNILTAGNEQNTIGSFITLPMPPKGRKSLLGNHITGAFLHIPTRNFESCLERLDECHRVLNKTNRTILPSFFNFFVNTAGMHLRWIARFLGRNRMFPIALSNLPIANVEPVSSVVGKEFLMAEFIAGGLEGVVGVGFVVTSFREHIRISVAAEASILPRDEVDLLIRHIEEEISTLYSLSNSNETDEGEQVKESVTSL